jgi:hypothetical protein
VQVLLGDYSAGVVSGFLLNPIDYKTNCICNGQGNPFDHPDAPGTACP